MRYLRLVLVILIILGVGQLRAQPGAEFSDSKLARQKTYEIRQPRASEEAFINMYLIPNRGRIRAPEPRLYIYAEVFQGYTGGRGDEYHFDVALLNNLPHRVSVDSVLTFVTVALDSIRFSAGVTTVIYRPVDEKHLLADGWYIGSGQSDTVSVGTDTWTVLLQDELSKATDRHLGLYVAVYYRSVGIPSIEHYFGWVLVPFKELPWIVDAWRQRRSGKSFAGYRVLGGRTYLRF